MSRKIEIHASRRWGNGGGKRALRSVWLAALAGGLLFACSDDGADGADDTTDAEGLPRLEVRHEPTCGGYAQRLRDCDLLTDGKFSCGEPETPTQTCIFDCLTQASCSLLAQHRCGGGTPPAIARCLGRCEYFTCDEDYLIPLSWVCDHALDCSDGTDELDCEYFQCGSGEEVNVADECDAQLDCVDGSDETECPKFTCTDGSVIPEQWQCDLERDCADASDEAGCDRFVCEVNGEELPAEWHCDLEDDCLDGADEVGCAQLVCY